MSVWFFIVLVVGVLYVLNRLTTTTDLPVSAVLAKAREMVEQGHRRDHAAGPSAVPMAVRTEPNDVGPAAEHYAESRAA